MAPPGGSSVANTTATQGRQTISSHSDSSTGSPHPDARLAAQVLRDRTKRESTVRALVFLAAFISFVISVSLWFAGHEHQGIFVGTWVPSILALGAMLVPRRAA